MIDKRKPGRPKADEPSSSVSTWMRVREHDALVKLARRCDLSVSAVVRALILQRLKPR